LKFGLAKYLVVALTTVVVLSYFWPSRHYDSIFWPASGKMRVERRAAHLDRSEIVNSQFCFDSGDKRNYIVIPKTGENQKNIEARNAIEFCGLKGMALRKTFTDDKVNAVIAIHRCAYKELTVERLLAEYKGAAHPVKRWCSVSVFATSDNFPVGETVRYWTE